ncbi:uncharacterized protein LOC142097170 isoform X1 [Mixophyes fleayi]|uniref:uncharacterized protein LOC142097170 isoform X1 n=1 Tax=Mixophyes fleayi TaxID=3061075 RepID=UPI003F4DD9ED
MSCFNALVAGIFSRDDYSSYEWLTNWIQSIRGVNDVRNVTITNSWSEFTSKVPKCSFVILYHSMNRGRINFSDVTDSLYGKELEHLSKVYGKDNVIVVIDDVTDSSELEKIRILEEQPSIGRLAGKLILFSEGQDNYNNMTQIQWQRTKELEKHIQRIAHKASIPNLALCLLLFTAALVIILLVIFQINGDYGQEHGNPPTEQWYNFSTEPNAISPTEQKGTSSNEPKVTSPTESKDTSTTEHKGSSTTEQKGTFLTEPKVPFQTEQKGSSPTEPKGFSLTEKKGTFSTEPNAIYSTDHRDTSPTEPKATSTSEKKATSPTEPKATSPTEPKGTSLIEQKGPSITEH